MTSELTKQRLEVLIDTACQDVIVEGVKSPFAKQWEMLEEINRGLWQITLAMLPYMPEWMLKQTVKSVAKDFKHQGPVCRNGVLCAKSLMFTNCNEKGESWQQ